MSGTTPGESIRFVRGVGPARAETLGRLGIDTLGDLLLHVPRAYLDRRFMRSISSLEPGIEATVSGEVTHVSERRLKGGRAVFHAYLSDGTGLLDLSFFNARYLKTRLVPGTRLVASGRMEFFRGPTMAHPDLTFLEEEQAGALDSGGMLPVYPLTAGLTQAVMRKLVGTVLETTRDNLEEVLPRHILEEAGFSSRWSVFQEVHSPCDPEGAAKARKILALEELYLHQCCLRIVRESAGIREGFPLVPGEASVGVFTARLPFTPTDAQRRVISEIRGDIGRRIPMRRLLQGDVGSGKTVVAAFACWAAHECNMQSAILAPTEVLAVQHHGTMSKLLGPLGVRCLLLTGGTPASLRNEILEEVSRGSRVLLIGTHAILEPPVTLPRHAILVVDEQHKFGVGQREELLRGRDPRPHLLVMSATPIPRTLAMAFYGDLDVSVLDEMPPGRGRTFTRILSEESRREAFSRLLERLEQGERAFIVYPLKEASEREDLLDAATAFRRLSAGPAGRYGVGLLHGSMSSSEKNERTGEFASGRIRVLVSTTVVEVGLDVPEATVMIVSGAGRFGLSQLHQLRGRVGRSSRDSWCFLIAGKDTGDRAMKRLEALVDTDDGFLLSKRDLQMRGPGDVLGTRQHGLPEFRIADIFEDEDLIGRAAALAASSPPDGSALREMEWRFGGMAGSAV